MPTALSLLSKPIDVPNKITAFDAMDYVVTETLFYFCFTAIFALVLFGMVALALLVYRAIANRGSRLSVLRRFALILGAVIVLGWPADFVWVFLFSGRWYLDRDHVYGFSPLFPFRLDTWCGDRFIGHGSYLTIEAAWLVFAVVVWLVAVKLVQQLAKHTKTDDSTPHVLAK
jgi:hypothetical protein